MTTKQRENLIQAVNRHNELMSKFNKAERFFDKYPNYEKTNPKECKELQNKLVAIVKEIAQLDWMYDCEIVKDTETNLISLPLPPTQKKLF